MGLEQLVSVATLLIGANTALAELKAALDQIWEVPSEKRQGLASTYGAAGSVVLLLVWAYYSAQVFLLGADFTRSYAYQLGSLCSARRARAAGDAGAATGLAPAAAGPLGPTAWVR